MAAILFGYGGYVLGNFYPLIKNKKKKQKPLFVVHEIGGEEDSQDGVESVSEIEQPSAEKKRRVLPSIMDPEATIQIWYDPKNRKIIPEIDGNFLDLENDISDEDEQTLTWFLIDLQDKVGLASSIKKKIVNLHDSDVEKEQTDESKLNPIKSFVNYIKSDVPKIEEKKESIPEQINGILQDQLIGTALEKKGISVTEWPEKGVMFMVGIDFYEDIEIIPSKKIQNAIKKAVKTWEENFGTKN